MARPAPLSFIAPANNNATANANDDEPPSPPAAGPSPPLTPRSLSFLTPPPHAGTPPAHPSSSSSFYPPTQNPFSPPASVLSFSASPFNTPGDTPAQTPGHNPSGSGSGYPFPNLSPGSTRASSLVDVPRAFSTASASASSNNVDAGTGRPTKREAFASPPARPLTIYAAPSTARLRRGRPKSTAILLNTTLVKPWVGTRDPRSRVAYWITYATICLGLAGGALRAYTGYTSVLLLHSPLCPVLLEDFSNTTTDQLFGSGVAGEGGVFFREVDASGFGNGEFEMTTASDANSFVYNNQLYLVPTLTSTVIPEGSILDGAIYNLTGCTYNITHSSGYTTSGHGAAGINSTSTNGTDIAPDTPLDLPAYLAACSAVSNATEGRILPPVMSARISTRKSASLRFGRVEVRAKLPTGDWLWPAIWMLPVDSAYGAWPLSGEIDIMEARGNGPSYPKQGINYVRSSLNWGPATFLNAVAKTYGWWTQRRGRYDDGFHTYALEWSEEFIRMYVDSRLDHMYETKLTESFWTRGDFPPVVQNGTESVVLENPWVNGTKAAPFDQAFYLIMNVAVGGTNGWFPDGPEKPWLDGSATAPLDFLRAQDQWYPSWPQDTFGRAMVMCVPFFLSPSVGLIGCDSDSVKMWEQC
ncbi:concanavalin A-like lectin/glucanase domain-containing protein [Mycena haematopus]|nr:concanavalin A-like lectin/glucanase domain-containing protein [Mycena haematopus]